MIEPGKGSFHDPLARQDGEALPRRWAQHALQDEATVLGHPLRQNWPTIAAIDPDAAQFLARSWEPLKELDGPIAFLHGGGSHRHRHE